MLKSAAGFIQRQVAGVLRLRNMPRLDWVYDETIAESMRVNDLIQDALKRDKSIAGDREEAAAPPAEPEE
jgi:ribosome-binding factor A